MTVYISQCWDDDVNKSIYDCPYRQAYELLMKEGHEVLCPRNSVIGLFFQKYHKNQSPKNLIKNLSEHLVEILEAVEKSDFVYFIHFACIEYGIPVRYATLQDGCHA